MELRTINTFLHIAELHSFSRAARELGIIVEQGHGQQGFLRIVRHPVGGGKGDDDLAAAVAAVGTVRESPTSARRHSRRSCRSLRGISVASTVMMEPLSSWGGMLLFSSVWIGVPATMRSSNSAWLESTSAPMV